MTPLALFSDLTTTNDEGKSVLVPIEQVEILPTEVKTDEKQRVKLPYLYLVKDGNTYQLHCWSMYAEEMNQLVEQVILKFTDKKEPKTKLVLKNIANNNSEGAKVIKFVFWMERNEEERSVSCVE